MTTDEIIDAVLEAEGRYVNHPADRGGPTNFGITQTVLGEYRASLGPAAAADFPADVRLLTAAHAREIYREVYIERPGFARWFSGPLLSLVVDIAVNHGVRRSLMWLQELAAVPVDGIVGPVTESALHALDPVSFYRRLCAKRVRFYGKLVTADPSQAVFAAGWANRVARFIEEAP